MSLNTAYKAGWLLERIHGLLCLEKEPKMTRFVAQQPAHDHWFSILKAQQLLDYTPQVSNEAGVQLLLASLGTDY
jgi:nucleoside-diphosphate-sugar epimerase